MKQNFIIDLGFIPFDIMVSINESDDELMMQLLEYNNKKDECSDLMNLGELTTGRCVMLPSGQTVIRLKMQSDTNKLIGVIAHESFHASSFVLEKIGVPLEIMVSDEIFGYMTGFIVYEICKKINI